jgi:hypothetical protein
LGTTIPDLGNARSKASLNAATDAKVSDSGKAQPVRLCCIIITVSITFNNAPSSLARHRGYAAQRAAQSNLLKKLSRLSPAPPPKGWTLTRVGVDIASVVAVVVKILLLSPS